MFNIFLTQLLPLLLALLGAILGVVFGLYMGPQASSRTWCISIIGLVSLTLAAIAYLICDGIKTDRKIQSLSAVIRQEVDLASNIEYRAREAGDAGRFQLGPFVGEIEAWRNRVDAWLRKELPESGADIRFRAGTGQVGAGPELYEYTRLTILRSNLLAVLDNLPSYVQRSH